jgi:MFS family permease
LLQKRYLAICAFSVGTIASQYLRNLVAVLSPGMTTDLDLTPGSFGWLSSALFLSFAVFQIPIGLAFDRFGVRWPTVLLMAIGILSVVLLSVSQNTWMAVLAQAGLGLAIAPIFTGLMIYASSAFREERNLIVVSFASAVGICGSLIAGSPLGWLTEALGWRQAVLWSLLFLLVPMIGVAFFVDDAHRVSDEHKVPTSPFSIRGTLWCIPLFLAIGVGGAFRTSWAGPYLEKGFGYDSRALGDAMLAASVVSVLVSFAIPPLLARWSDRLIIGALMLVGAVAATALALMPFASAAGSVAGLSALIALGALHPLVVNLVRERFPRSRHGLAVSLATMWAFLSVAVLSSSIGGSVEVVQAMSLPIGVGYTLIFAAAALLMCLSAWICARL